jgi:hypothetical protein
MQSFNNGANIRNISGQSKQSLRTDVDKSGFKRALTKKASLIFEIENSDYEKAF